jgi:hypothetical protein
MEAGRKAEDVARLGIMPLDKEGSFEPFAETYAWNFQQGSMLQWLASAPDTCLYNVYEKGEYGACVHNVRSGARRTLPRPVANVSRDGTKAVCINMSRVFDFRPGYGYEEIADPHRSVPAPEDDGVWVMDLATGANRLVLTLPQMVQFLEREGIALNGAKVVVNHITLNPSASRFLLLLRTFPELGKGWRTFLLTAAIDGSDLRNHPTWDMASHYHWRNDDEMLFWIFMGPEKKGALAVISDRTGTRTAVDPGFFKADGHCSYSPDGRWILYDSYPDATPDAMRGLMLYSLDRKEGKVLGRFRSERMSAASVDLRCDLHPRWMPDGKSITFDSIHEGYRGVYSMDLRGPVG